MASWDVKKKIKEVGGAGGCRGFWKIVCTSGKILATPLLKLMWMLLLTLIKRKDGYEQRLGGGRGLGRGAAQPWSTPVFFFFFTPRYFPNHSINVRYLIQYIAWNRPIAYRAFSSRGVSGQIWKGHTWYHYPICKSWPHPSTYLATNV